MGLNYINQLLVSRGNHKGQEYLISKSRMRENYNRLVEVITGKNGYQDEIEREEALAKLRIAYLNIMEAIRDENKGTQIEDDSEFDKKSVKRTAEETSERAKREYLRYKAQREENSRKYNEYSELFIQARSNIEEVRRRYLKSLKEWNTQLDSRIQQEDYDPIKTIKTEAILLGKMQAFINLSDPDYKMKLDEILLFNFDPNQERLYTPHDIAEVTYLPEEPIARIDPNTGEKHYSLTSLKFGDITTGDDSEVIVIHTGNIGFGRFRNWNKGGEVTYKSTRELKDYKVIKRYKDPSLAARRKATSEKEGALSIWDDQLDGEVFRVSGDLHEGILLSEDVDLNLLRYTQEVLLSNTNLEEAIEHNGGYIGVVGIDRERNEYVVNHDRDGVICAKEFQRIAKNIPLDGKIAKYKIDQGILELYQKNPRTGQYTQQRMFINPNPPATPRRKNIEDLGER